MYISLFSTLHARPAFDCGCSLTLSLRQFRQSFSRPFALDGSFTADDPGCDDGIQQYFD